MIPASHERDGGLRPVGDPHMLLKVLSRLGVPPKEEEIEQDFGDRQRHMRASLKSGSFEKIASTVRILFFVGTKRTLNVIDQRLLAKGKGILASELALALGEEIPDVMKKIGDNLAKMPER